VLDDFEPFLAVFFIILKDNFSIFLYIVEDKKFLDTNIKQTKTKILDKPVLYSKDKLKISKP
jgi:hypothetical protein